MWVLIRNAAALVGLLLLVGLCVKSARDIAALRKDVGALSDQLKDSSAVQRPTTLLRQMRQIGGPFVLILGDSITQGATLPNEVCGYPIINAGISGSRASNLIPFAEEIKAQRSQILVAVVAVGVNDAQKHYETQFGYRLLLDSLPSTKLLLATTAPVDFSGTIGSRIDPDKYKVVDAEIRSIAATRRLSLIDLSKLEPRTLDGVHLTLDDYAKWNAAVLGGIRSALEC